MPDEQQVGEWRVGYDVQVDSFTVEREGQIIAGFDSEKSAETMRDILNQYVADLAAAEHRAEVVKGKAALCDWMAAMDNNYDAAVMSRVFDEFMARYHALTTEVKSDG